MGAKSQRKGRNGEAELTAILNNNGIPAKIGKAVSYGQTPDIYNVEHIHVECKRTEKLRLSEWMRQATADAAKFGDGWPTIFHRRNRESWLCTMPLMAWLELYKLAFSGENRRSEPPGKVGDRF